MKPLSECALYTFIDSAYLHGRDPVALTEDLCEGGSDLIQLRAKDWAPSQIKAVAVRMLPITTRYNVGLVINDHLAIAQKIGAPLCHLGQEDFFEGGYSNVDQLPLPVPPLIQPAIGLSTHSPEQAAKAVSANPAYIAVGPVFPTGTKPSAKPVTLEYVRWAAQNVPIPWFAIGGINLQNLGEVLVAGARRICVVSAVLNTPDPKQSCRKFKELLEGTGRFP